jgi:hypothetical protein
MQIGYCNPLNFLKRLISQDTAIKQGDRQTTRTIKSLCHYFLETMAINREFLAFPPSMQAAASYFLAIKTIYNGSWVCAAHNFINTANFDYVDFSTLFGAWIFRARLVAMCLCSLGMYQESSRDHL